MTTITPPNVTTLGLGIGWRPELALAIERRADLGFVEVIAEDLDPAGPLPRAIEQLVERGVRVIPHGVSLSLGGAEPIDLRRVERLARLAQRLGSPMVSEHICFVRAGGAEAGHLLPLPRTREALDVLAANVAAAKQMLSVPLALENIAALFEWPAGEMDEAAFVTEALRRTDSLLLLDLANVWANARNHADGSGGDDPAAMLAGLPLDRLAYVHVAGGAERDGLYHDTHADPVPRGVLDLLSELSARADVPGVMLERDDHFPTPGELNRELDEIRDAVATGGCRRRALLAGGARA
jgi:uncharacterized protein (UPF0276 family)